MILSTQKFNSDLPLMGCGVDIENIDRFNKWAETPPPFIYSESEIKQLLSLSDKLPYLCAIFCVKEALFKALKRPYNFNECSVDSLIFSKELSLRFKPSLIKEYNIHRCMFFLTLLDDRKIIAEVYLY